MNLRIVRGIVRVLYGAFAAATMSAAGWLFAGALGVRVNPVFDALVGVTGLLVAVAVVMAAVVALYAIGAALMDD